MRCQKKHATEPGNDDKEEAEMMELSQKLPISHDLLRVMKVQLVPRGCWGVNSTGFCNMPQKNSQLGSQEESILMSLYVLGQGDQLSWELSHPNLLSGIPHLGWQK